MMEASKLLTFPRTPNALYLCHAFLGKFLINLQIQAAVLADLSSSADMLLLVHVGFKLLQVDSCRGPQR